MNLLFDGDSRFQSQVQLLAIRVEGLVDEELLAKLSDEFREQIDLK